MASPAISLYRLPTQAEANRVLLAAAGRPADSKEVKERRNLCRALDWAYKGLSPADKAIAIGQYPNLVADLATGMQKPHALADATILAMLNAMIAGKPALQHPGGARLAVLTHAQKATIDLVLFRLQRHVLEIESGRHDAFIEQVFPAETGNSVWKIVGRSNADVVKDIFTRAVAAAKRVHAAGNIKVDVYASTIKAGGLTNPQALSLAETFFGLPLNEQEAVLGHESTHAIADDGCRTNDNGGYLGSQQFHAADFAVRRKNAAHFEAVIRLINGEALPPIEAGGVMDATGETIELVRRAWTRGLNLYLDLQKYQAAPATVAGGPAYVTNISQLLGLGLHKQPAIHAVNDSDLASAENRVCKLGVLLGAVRTASASVAANNPPITVDKILAKLVEMEGPLRKTAGHVKTVAMIKTLAHMSNANVAKFVRKDYS